MEFGVGGTDAVIRFLSAAVRHNEDNLQCSDQITEMTALHQQCLFVSCLQ